MLNNLYLITPIANFLSDITGLNAEVFAGILNGIFEMTHGCMDISQIDISPTALACICSALITFGGIATMLQAYAFLQKFGMRLGFFLKQKLTHTLLSTLLCFILCLIFIN